MAYKTISAKKLIEKFKFALENKWGYIWGKAGVLWTQKMQDCVKDEQAKRYGQKWVGHNVADCSGLFYWAFKVLSSYTYHGSNTMWNKYCVAKGNLKAGKRADGKELKPGTAIFTDKDGDKTHVGLYIGNGDVIEAQGTRYGVVTSKITNKKWKCWGELKYVDYKNAAKVTEKKEEKKVYPTIRYGSKGEYVTILQELLVKNGSTIKIDGIFGIGTQSAVRAYQKKNGLVVDGIVGPKTWGKLLEK